MPRIHHSRFIRFDGSPISEDGFRQNDYWHDSYLTILLDMARRYDEAYNGVMVALKDFGVNVLQLKDLSSLVSSKRKNELLDRIKLMNISKSILSTILLDADGENYQLVERTFSNIGAVLDKLDKRLQMVTGLPHTILFGEGSTGTLGAGGESEQNTLADLIASVQETQLRRQFEIYAKIVQSQKDGPTKGNLIKYYSFNFNPLNEPTGKQQADYRRTVAETDRMYYEMGAVTSTEISDSRFGGDGYSSEMKIDKEAREMQKDLDSEKLTTKKEVEIQRREQPKKPDQNEIRETAIQKKKTTETKPTVRD